MGGGTARYGWGMPAALLAASLFTLCQGPPAGPPLIGPPPAGPLLVGRVVDAAGSPRGGGAVVAVARAEEERPRGPLDGPAPERTALRVPVAADGTFSLNRLPDVTADDVYVLLATVADGDRAAGWAQVPVRPDRTAPDTTVTVRPTGRLVLRLRDGFGRPLAGVRATRVLWTTPVSDGVRAASVGTAALATARGAAWEPSDAAGRLELPGLWAGSSVRIFLVFLVRPDGPAVTASAEVPAADRDPLPAPARTAALLRLFVPALAPVLAPGSELFRAWLLDETVPVQISAGTVRVTVRLPEIGPELPTDGYTLSGSVDGNGKKSPVRNLSPAVATRGPDGSVVLEWRLLAGPADVWIRHPTVLLDLESRRLELTVAPGRPAEMTIDAVPVVTVVGRLVDAVTGESLAGIGPWRPGGPSGYPRGGPAVKAYRMSRDPNWLNGYRAGRGWIGLNSPSPWAGVDHTAADADGRFTLRIPAAILRDGRVRVIGFDLPGGRLPAVADLAGAAGETLDAGDLRLARPPEIAGMVVDAAGAPVAGTAVTDGGTGLSASKLMLGEAVTDAAGRFRLAPRVGHRPTVGADGGVTVDLLAFDPAANREGAAAVVLRPGEDPPPVRLVLTDTPPPPLPEAPPGWTWPGVRPGVLRVGDPAPAWTAAAAFGPGGVPLAEPPTLAGLRGRWVLLELRPWPPGNDDGADARKVAAAYGDRLTVVTVFEHDADPAAVRAGLAADPAPGPALIDAAPTDAAGGATFAAYGAHKFHRLPHRLPDRFLIDPAGRVVAGPGVGYLRKIGRRPLRNLRPFLAPR